jgi:cytochrome P450
MNTIPQAERDFFSDPSVLADPSEYFRDIFARSPVEQLRIRDLLMVTGFEESLEVLRNQQDFSSVITVGGPVAPLPFVPDGSDITAQIEVHRSEISGADLLVSYDDELHASSRALLSRLFVPSRLKANEDYMLGLADRMVMASVEKGGCEFMNEIATPYATLVIADLLGVPDEDRETFSRVLASGPPPGSIEAGTTSTSPLEFMAGFFFRYIQERRAAPQGDVLTELAQATYPDGTTPDVVELVKLSSVLFGAGQDTSAKLLGNCILALARDKELQTRIREERSLLPAFIEEMLRIEGSAKVTFRLARRDTSIGGVSVPAGKKVAIGLTAANRDPRRWPEPDLLKLDRPRAKEHVAFGRGAHVCPGAPLARAEVRVMLDRFIERTSDISLSVEHHGPDGDQCLEYEPSYIVRGLVRMHLSLAPR